MKASRFFYWVSGALIVIGVALALLLDTPRLLFVMIWPVTIFAVTRNAANWGLRENHSRRRYKPRDTGAGRWLEAPVAELDKSTVGKLLASRASRDPAVHVVPGGTTPEPARSDVLYDREIDG